MPARLASPCLYAVTQALSTARCAEIVHASARGSYATPLRAAAARGSTLAPIRASTLRTRCTHLVLVTARREKRRAASRRCLWANKSVATRERERGSGVRVPRCAPLERRLILTWHAARRSATGRRYTRLADVRRCRKLLFSSL